MRMSRALFRRPVRFSTPFSFLSTAAEQAAVCGEKRGIFRLPAVLLSLCLVAGTAGATTITVSNTSDSGAGSLRDALTTANGDSGDTIQITATGTITLQSALPAIEASMSIVGPGANNLTISGANAYTVLTIDTGTVSISGVTISNGASSCGGGGEYGAGICSGGTVTVTNSVFSNNVASGTGGGIFSEGTLTVIGCTFSNNTATQNGGGISNNGALTVINSTFEGNSAEYGGGLSSNTGDSLTIEDSTISGNSATGNSGGILNEGSMTLANTIVAGNTAPSLSDVGQDGTYTDNGGNLIGTSGINLATLANYGGTTQTMLPLPNSPALCAGSASAVPGGTTTDQRGVALSPASSYCTSGQIDSGAVQTRYSAIQFTNAGSSGYAASVNTAPTTSPAVSVTEDGTTVPGVPVTLTFDGAGTASGLGPVATAGVLGSAVATFTNISVTEAGSDTLTATLPIPGSSQPSTTANLKIVKITLSPTTLSAATANHAYNQTFTASGGSDSTYTYTVSAGALPTGLSLSSGGTLSGAPSATGSFNFTVKATDGNNFSGTQSYSLTVNAALAASQDVASTVLTQNHAASSFTPVTATGGTTPLSYSVSPTLPSGLSLNTSTGAITGTPTATSVATSYTITVTDNNSATATANFSLTVNSAVTATQAVASAVLTQNHTITAFTPVTGGGGTGTLTYSVSPTLPAGVAFSSSTGAITGTPTASSANTTYTVTVTDSNNATASNTFTLQVYAAPSATTAIASASLTAGQSASAFMPVTGSGGAAPLTYSIAPSLPNALTLNTSTGAISGTPSTPTVATTYTVTVTDKNGATANASFILTVNAAVSATTAVPATTLTAQQAASAFTPVTATGGTAPLSYSVSPALPNGLSLSASTGAISGTPSAASAASTYAITVTDKNGATASANFSLTVNSAISATGTAETLTVNQSANFTPVAVTGGTAPLTYSISPSLPSGLTLNTSTGAITGTQLATSTATSYTITITDTNNAKTTASFALTVNQAISSVAVTSSSAGNTSNVNDPVTFTASVTPYSGTSPLSPPFPGSAAALSGTVTFKDNGTPICTGATVSLVSGNYVATCATKLLSGTPSSHTITALYSGDSNYSGSSNNVTQTVNKSNSSLVVASSGSTTVNQQATFTATITPYDGTTALTPPYTGSVALTGSVTFIAVNTGTSASTTLCSGVVVSGTTASCSTQALPAGSYNVTATYGNDGNYNTSNNSTAQTVSPATVALGLTSSPNPGTINKPVTFNAAVTAPSGPVTLTGTVSFTDGSNAIAACPPVTINPNSPTVSCVTSALTLGPHTITASYTGDPNFSAPSQSENTSINAATTQTALVSSSASGTSSVDQPVTFTATVTGPSGAAKLSGSVAFTDNNNAIAGCSAVAVNSVGVAACQTSALTKGAHAIVATFGAGQTVDNFSSSISSPLTQTVSAAASSVTLTSSQNPSVVLNPKNYHDQIVLTASVSPNSGGVPLSGSVTFTDNGGPIAECSSAVPVNAASGVATCTTSSLTFGSHTIEAAYNSDPNFTASTASIAQNVEDYSISAVTSGPVSITQGYTNATDPFAPQTVTVSATSIAGFTGSLTLTACNVVPVTAPENAVLPTCSFGGSSLTVPGGNPVPVTINTQVSSSSVASPGIYNVSVVAVDSTTGLTRNAAPFPVQVIFQAAPLTIVSGATTGNTTNLQFTLPPNVSLSNIQCVSVTGKTLTSSVAPVALSIGCSFNPSSIPASTTSQTAQVTVTITTGGTSTTSRLNDGSRSTLVLAGLLGIPLLALLGFMPNGRKARNLFLRSLVVIFVLGLILQATGCGGGKFTAPPSVSGQTPPGSYNILVQGTGSDKQTYQSIIQVNVVR